ncbi:hypothetical protein GQ457_10G009480 [Hibiscus cannabinus]
MSPYIFVLCMERLSQMINAKVLADDLIIFVEASSRQVQLIQPVLEDFCFMLGHRVNVSKTQIVTKATFSYLLEKMKSRLSGWAAKYLSLVGRITFAKWLLHVIMFVWDSAFGGSGIALVRWDIAKEPVKEGETLVHVLKGNMVERRLFLLLFDILMVHVFGMVFVKFGMSLAIDMVSIDWLRLSTWLLRCREDGRSRATLKELSGECGDTKG